MSTEQQPQQLTVKEDIEQGNRLIAEFMGYKFSGDGKKMHFNITQPGGGEWYYASWEREGFDRHIAEAFKYHSSWEVLMPVVEKIADTPMEDFINDKTEDGGYAYPVTFGMRTQIGQWMVRFKGHVLHEADTLIHAAWLGVVDFIQWYNTQKQ